MKKLLTLLLTLTILAGTLGACKPADNNPATSSSDPGASQTETSEEVSGGWLSYHVLTDDNLEDVLKILASKLNK